MDMDWVADGIAIGGRRDAVDQAGLERAGIEAVLQLYGPEREPLNLAFAAAVRSLYVIDGQPLASALIHEGVAFIRGQRAQGRRVLVACGAGQSRSAVFVAAFLHAQGAELLEAFCSIMSCRPQILPHPVLLQSLVECCGAPTTAEALLVALVKQKRQLRGGAA